MCVREWTGWFWFSQPLSSPHPMTHQVTLFSSCLFWSAQSIRSFIW